jgi:hypothetical protein
MSAAGKAVVLVHGGFVDGAGWKGVHDRMIPPVAQRRMAERAEAKVTAAPGSHAIYVSRPAAVADLGKDAAAAIWPRLRRQPPTGRRRRSGSPGNG